MNSTKSVANKNKAKDDCTFCSPEDNNTTAFKSANHYSDHVTRFTKHHALDLVDAAYNELKNATKILEIGCGTGVFGMAYLERFPKGIVGQKIYCTDLNRAMVEVAQHKIAEKMDTMTCQTEFLFQEIDGTNLEIFNDNMFDLVVSVFGIFLIQDRDTVLKEVRRVLKQNDGVLAMTAWTKTNYNEELRLSGFGANLHEAMSLMRLPAKSETSTTATNISINTRPQILLPQHVLDWFEPSQVKEILTKHSMYHNISVHRAMHTVCVPNVETLWNTFSSGSKGTEIEDPHQHEIVTAAKMVLGEYVAIDGKVDQPMFIRTVSNIIIAL